MQALVVPRDTAQGVTLRYVTPDDEDQLRALVGGHLHHDSIPVLEAVMITNHDLQVGGAMNADRLNSRATWFAAKVGVKVPLRGYWLGDALFLGEGPDGKLTNVPDQIIAALFGLNRDKATREQLERALVGLRAL